MDIKKISESKKSGWKSWDYPKKGRVIATFVFLFCFFFSSVSMILYIFEKTGWMFTVSNIFVGITRALAPINKVALIGLGLFPRIESIYLYLILGGITSFVIDLYLGTLIGWIYGKIKQRKEEK